MKVYEFQGKNVQKAIEEGLKELNKSQFDVDIKVLESGGLFKKAKVQIIVEDDEEVVAYAISKLGRSLIYASNRFKTDKSWIQKAFDRDQAAFIVDDEAARIFNILDSKMVKECARRKATDFAGEYYIPDENKVYKHKVYRKYKDFYEGKIITAGQMLRMQEELLEDKNSNYISYKLDF